MPTPYGGTPTPAVPAAPTGLNATPGDAQVALAWTASTGATSYHVKRATTSGGTYTQVSAPTNTTYTDTGRTNGTKYYYVVSALNLVGESGNSSEASATPAVALPVTGNPNGHDTVPTEASAEDVSVPDHVIGNGTPESCTADAFINAVALGGKITFNGGTNPFTIVLNRPAKVFNDKPDLVIDGGGLVTLSGAGVTRILYMNTCDSAQVWTTSHCDNQDHPHLAVQNLTFINGNSKNISNTNESGGGGAIWVSGGRFKIVNCRFFSNVCADQGPDVGGAAVRVFSQYQGLPVYVVNSTFGGASAYGGSGSNGGGISSIGVSWAIYNSVFSYNHAIGNGGNPAQTGTPGGGSGGAIYMDGNTMKLSLYGTLIEENYVNAFGSAIFLVSNNHDGTLHVENSILRNNHGGSWYFLPGISGFSDTKQEIINSTIQ